LDEVYNIQDHTISIGLETISDKFFVDTMKHYIKRNLYAEGVILDKPELEIKGMDLKKRATSVIGSELQEKLIDVIFESKNSEEDLKDYIVNFDKKIEKRRKNECRMIMGQEFRNKCFCDLDTKRKWFAIVNLYLAEIEQLEAEF